MELWIRSQDKTVLEKVNQLIIRENCNESNEINYVIQGCYSLGYYKTKERALEVLDEIQNLMRSLTDSDLKIIQYEMPKD